MKVIYSIDDIAAKKPIGVGLGNFDGLHIGHMVLINTLITECGFSGMESMIYTFTKHPENILRKKLFTPLLTPVNKKIKLLGDTSLNYLYFDEFDENFSRLTSGAFVKKILVDRLRIKLAVAGFDYRFGYKGQGDVNLLKELGKNYGFKVMVIPPVKLDNEVISSTLIRNYVAKGGMDKVFKLLGRHYSITGIVGKGRNVGSNLGFPTANIVPEDNISFPLDGVYITKTLIGDGMFRSITNIGKNPTFGIDSISIETYILDFKENIYGKNIEVFFISRLRGEKKFESAEKLIRQIETDIKAAKEFFNTDEN